MATLDWLDYSWARPSPASMAAGGIRGVSRYLWNGGKGVTAEEITTLHAHGLAVLANYEASAGMVLEGTTRAIEHAKAAVGIADKLSWPHGKPIVHSADRDLTGPAEYRKLGEYFDAVNRNRGEYAVGAYGEADVIDWLTTRGLITFGWQTVAWSNRRISDHAHLHQFSINNLWGGAAVDFNRVLDSTAVAAAAWLPPGAESTEGGGKPVKLPTPATPEHPTEEHAVADGDYELIRNVKTGAVRAAGKNFWRELEGKTPEETLANISRARTSPLCGNSGIVRDVSDAGMAWLKAFYTGKA